MLKPRSLVAGLCRDDMKNAFSRHSSEGWSLTTLDASASIGETFLRWYCPDLLSLRPEGDISSNG